LDALTCASLTGDRVKMAQPFNVDIKTAEQRTIILHYGDWYTGR